MRSYASVLRPIREFPISWCWSSDVNDYSTSQAGGYRSCHKYAGPRLCQSLRIEAMMLYHFQALLLLFASGLVSTCIAFTNPIKSVDGSDPFMVYHDGYYYLTSRVLLFLPIIILLLRWSTLISNYVDQCSNHPWHSASLSRRDVVETHIICWPAIIFVDHARAERCHS